MTTPAEAHARLAAYLATDPDNIALLADTAQAALAAGEWDMAETLADRHDALAGPGPAMTHLRGLLAMARQDWDAACDTFARLLDLGVDAPAIRFNLAWSHAMAGRPDAALALLDDAVVAQIPQAAQLHVGLLHHHGDLDAAEAAARAAIDRFPDHIGLNADVSTLAIDLEDMALARMTAQRAGSHPAALVTQGVLALDAADADTAAHRFDAALTSDPGNGRAWVGRGLVGLHRQDFAAAAADLDRGAAIFGEHLGSWIAAGWAWLLAGDRAAARERFARALTIDDNFAEAHGSMAVLDLLAGDTAAARSGIAVAVRLDQQSFSAALAAAMLAASDGDAVQAERIVALALATPINADGRTIADALGQISRQQ
ncbi:tetratricopeptide repeat protein [Sphingomonas sp. Leaf4]|uniref:tetratricopeptide repeat protein n=1 Tax=Sphingomonas sp. Leaf4 TaxID=2876553 RepID=UPI001E470FD3|nr:tetratricopeptide repeat protein [Sphingomonas sp. Leaf4]